MVEYRKSHDKKTSKNKHLAYQMNDMEKSYGNKDLFPFGKFGK